MATSSKSGKKPISKDDLRRLMREKKNTQHTSKKRIDSPFAKYNTIGQLVCVVCNSQVKSDLLWNAHIQGRTHKENVAALKAKNEARNTPSVSLPPGSLKRPHPDGGADSSIKHVKLSSNGSGGKAKGLPADFIEKQSSEPERLGLGGYESSDEEMEVDDVSTSKSAPVPTPGGSASSLPPGLPTDFFDSAIAAKPTKPAPDEPKIASMAEKLPEGFFDDPKQDAKVRKVEYRDKLDDEWELFQKAMKEEASISEAIQEEDDEALISERNINEIDEQIHRWSKVDNLAKKKEELMSKDPQGGRKEGSSSDSDIDEEDFDQLLHWRTKLIGNKGEIS